MKMLFIGHYKESSGWSHAAINTILASDRSGLDVVCRNIKLTNEEGDAPKEIKSLESKDLKNIDYCIQNVLPHHLVATQKFKKNIAYFVGESSTIKHTAWLNHLQLMDEVWVPNTSLQKSMLEDGIKNTKVVPYAFNLANYENNEDKFSFGDNSHKFKFYYIGDLNDRKNIATIIKCFHSEFHRSEQVALVLKLKKFGVSKDSLNQYVNQLCSNIKKALRIYPSIEHYHKELIICENLNLRGILGLHNSCDCFISPSRGEGWSIPAFEAMCFGKTPICSKEGGPLDFINQTNPSTGTLIDGVYSVCDHSDPAFNDIFTGREEWFTPSERDIKRAMRYYYENRDSIDRKAGLLEAQKFSYDNVGNIIKEALND